MAPVAPVLAQQKPSAMQQVAQAAAPAGSDTVALPPVVVQGATLAPPAPVRKKPTADYAPPPQPDPEPVKAKPKTKAKPTNDVAATSKPKATTAGNGGGADGGGSGTSGAGAGSGDAGSAGEGAGSFGGDAASGGAAGAGAAGSGTPVERQGASVTVLTRPDIEAQQTRSAVELLRSLPGVNVTRTGSPAGLATVSLRGGGSQHTLVIIDGMEANDPSDGAFDFSNLSADDIERIEVVRGPMSGIYGSKAVGGVINIVTRGGRGPLTLEGRVEGGSLSTGNVAARISGGNDRAWIAASVSAMKTHGFNISPEGSELDGARQTTLSLRAGVQIVDGVTLDVTVRNMSKSGDRDGFMPITGLATAVDDPSTFSTNVWMTGANLRWDSMGGALTQMLKVARTQTTNTDLDLSFPAFPFASANEGIVTRYGYLATYRFGTPGLLGAKHALTGLIERESEEFTPSGDFADGIHRQRNRNSVAGEYSVDLLDRLTLSGNVRHDGNESFQDYDTWRAAASLRLPELGLRPHASVGTAVKFPTMFEQCGSTALFEPNPLLKPEESFGWDAGLEVTFARGFALVDVTYFENDLTNSITTTFSPKFTAVNLAGESHRRGVEVTARARLTRELTLGGAYTWLDAHDPDGRQSIRRAPHTGRVDLNYAFLGGKANFNAAAIYNSGGIDIGLNPDYSTTRVALQDYWLVNIAASYKIAPGVEVFARGENLLDSKYQELFGYNTAGITAFAGVKLTYEDPSTASWAKYK